MKCLPQKGVDPNRRCPYHAYKFPQMYMNSEATGLSTPLGACVFRVLEQIAQTLPRLSNLSKDT